MKKVEEVLNQLSKLYEFNKKLQAYKLKKKDNQDQQIVRTDSKKRYRFE